MRPGQPLKDRDILVAENTSMATSVSGASEPAGLRLLLPKEHGSWGILLVPFLTGVAVAGEWNLPVLLALVAVAAVFLARPSLELLIPGKGGSPSSSDRASGMKGLVLFAGVALAATVPLLTVFHRWLLLWLAFGALAIFAIYLWAHHARQRPGKSGTEQLIATFGLTLTSLAGYGAALGRWDARGFWVWLLQAFFFLGGVLYVRYKVRAIPARQRLDTLAGRILFAWPLVVYHLFLLGLLVSLAVVHRLSWAVLFAFAPVLLRAAYGFVRLGERFAIKRLGWTEVVHSLLFACLLILALR